MSDEAAGRVVPHPDLEGQYDHTIDEKGRVSVPAEFRAALGLQEGDEVVVTRHINEQCLRVYRPDAWEAFKARVDAMENTVVATAVRKVVCGSARRMKLDRLGRVSLPVVLRQFAALQADCFVMGQRDCIVIWDQLLWNAKHGPDAFANLDASALSAINL